MQGIYIDKPAVPAFLPLTYIAVAVLGGLVIQFLPVLADTLSKNLAWPVCGAFLIASLWLAPHGLVGLYRRWIRRDVSSG